MTVSYYRRNPYPPVQRERMLEDRLVDFFAGHADTVKVTRQYRFPDGKRADIVVEAVLPDLDEYTRIFTVVEVKACKAGVRALAQLNGYLLNMREILLASDRRNWMLAGILAAPRFDPMIEDYAARCAYDDTLFSIWPLQP